VFARSVPGLAPQFVGQLLHFRVALRGL
jgi:hypothetical protein